MTLQEQLKQAFDAAEAVLAKAADNEDGLLTEEQQTEYDGLLKQADKIQVMIENQSKLDAQKAKAKQPVGEPAIETIPAASIEVVREEGDGLSGFLNYGEFFSAVQAACQTGGLTDDRLSIQAAAPTSPHKESSSEEGFMVPLDLREEIWRLVLDEDDMLARVNPEPTASNTVGLVVDQSTPWGAEGIVAKWASEVGTLAETKLDTEGRQVRLHKLFAFVAVSDELLEDAPRLQSRLMQKAPEAISWEASDAIVNGSGAGKPLGWFDSENKSLITVAKESGQTANTIVAANIFKMYSRLWRGGSDDSFWLINHDAFPQLLNLVLGNIPVFLPANAGITDAPMGSILGRPVVISQHAQTIGTKGDIQLISPRGYYATSKAAGVKFDSSIHLFFDTGATAFRWTFRIGGEPVLAKAIDPANGTSTLSHFVTLATRS